MIQTETGAREGVLSSKQIDNIPVMGRSALELLRILPGVVVEANIGDNTGSAKDVQNYTVNGIRSSGNTAQLDGSNLLDIGCNCGMMVSLNSDMISEVKVQSSNFAAEYGAGGMNVSGVTKAGTSSFHGEGYYYLRDSKFAANDRSNSILGQPKGKASYKYPASTSAARSSSATNTPRTRTSCSSSSPTSGSDRTWIRAAGSRARSRRR